MIKYSRCGLEGSKIVEHEPKRGYDSVTSVKKLCAGPKKKKRVDLQTTPGSGSANRDDASRPCGLRVPFYQARQRILCSIEPGTKFGIIVP